MRKFLCVAVLLGLMGLAAAPAQAAKHSIDSTVIINTIGETGNPPISGSQDYAGSVNGALGSGAVLGHNDFGPNIGQFQGSVRAFFKKGTLKGTLSGSGSPTQGQSGGASFTGTGEINKGTGKYKGAKGKFTFTGSVPPNSMITTFQIDGFVKY